MVFEYILTEFKFILSVVQVLLLFDTDGLLYGVATVSVIILCDVLIFIIDEMMPPVLLWGWLGFRFL